MRFPSKSCAQTWFAAGGGGYFPGILLYFDLLLSLGHSSALKSKGAPNADEAGVFAAVLLYEFPGEEM
jgi:hypothetical protein